MSLPAKAGRAALTVAVALTLGSLAGASCAGAQEPPVRSVAQEAALRIDSISLAADLGVLAADSMEGRRTGTPGAERARRFLVRRMGEIGVESYGGFERPFAYTGRGDDAPREGVNVIGFVPGTERPDQVIVVSAHYDHLGVRDGQIFNGADDDASGTSGVLAIAEHLRAAPPRHTVVFALFDAEESGLRGARAFVEEPPVPISSIVANVNLDMVGRNEAGELYAAGTYHYPQLLPIVREVQAVAPVTLLVGHDRPDLGPGDDWTNSSDHGPFHAVGIPFLYFGVEDHPDYHRATDDPDRIPAGFHARAVETVLEALLRLDRRE